MSAFKQNPFLIGFTVVMVLGVGALGYLAYSASDEHSKARSDYDNEASELKRLQGLRPFPNEEHLKKFQAQKLELQGKVDAIQKELASKKIKIEDISPTGFQDKLRDAVARVTSKAPESNVALPEKFYMGFPIYQSEPPKAPAAPALYRELRAIEAVMNLILEVKNVKLDELSRSELKEEKKPVPVDPTKKKEKSKDEDGRKLVEKDTFTLKFTTTQENFQRILNGIASHKEQLFVPRYIVVANEKQDAPPKVAAVPAAPPPTGAPPENPTNPPVTPAPADPAAAAAAAAAAAGPKLEYIFGKETVTVTMEVDLIDVKDLEPKK